MTSPPLPSPTSLTHLLSFYTCVNVTHDTSHLPPAPPRTPFSHHLITIISHFPFWCCYALLLSPQMLIFSSPPPPSLPPSAPSRLPSYVYCFTPFSPSPSFKRSVVRETAGLETVLRAFWGECFTRAVKATRGDIRRLKKRTNTRMSRQSPGEAGEAGRGRKREFLLRLEALALLPHSDAMRKQKRTERKEGKTGMKSGPK